jgi:arginine utilization protein RocB
MMIEDFGARVASVWEGLRSTTRSLLEKALQSSVAGTATTQPARAAEGRPYDARADWELSRLLAALDERAAEAGASLNAEQAKELRRMADTTAFVLQNQTQSAEVFAQLVARAHRARDYARIDRLADALNARFAPSEICELARCNDAIVRALAQEALAQAPISVLVGLLVDPVDSEIARDALERQAVEYGSEEARRIVNVLDQADSVEDDL